MTTPPDSIACRHGHQACSECTALPHGTVYLDLSNGPDYREPCDFEACDNAATEARGEMMTYCSMHAAEHDENVREATEAYEDK